MIKVQSQPFLCPQTWLYCKHKKFICSHKSTSKCCINSSVKHSSTTWWPSSLRSPIKTSMNQYFCSHSYWGNSKVQAILESTMSFELASTQDRHVLTLSCRHLYFQDLGVAGIQVMFCMMKIVPGTRLKSLVLPCIRLVFWKCQRRGRSNAISPKTASTHQKKKKLLPCLLLVFVNKNTQPDTRFRG